MQRKQLLLPSAAAVTAVVAAAFFCAGWFGKPKEEGEITEEQRVMKKGLKWICGILAAYNDKDNEKNVLNAPPGSA